MVNPTAQEVLDALLLVTQTNLEESEKSFIEARAVWEEHWRDSGNMVSFHLHVRNLLNDLVKISAIGERVAMLEYFIKILNEAKEMCQVE